MLSGFLVDALFPFNEERVIPDGVNRDSAIIGGIKYCCVDVYRMGLNSQHNTGNFYFDFVT